MTVLWWEMACFHTDKSSPSPPTFAALSGRSKHFLTTNLMQCGFLSKRLHKTLCLRHEEVQKTCGGDVGMEGGNESGRDGRVVISWPLMTRWRHAGIQ